MTNQEQYEILCDIYDRYKNGKLVEVVRCKDCKWWDVDSDCIFCEYGRVPKDDWFCADGKEKNDEIV